MDTFEPTREQRSVIEHEGSHLLVFAGPGTGKTETLARRFAWLVAERGVAPAEILVLTFSRHATGAMRERIVKRLRESAAGAFAVRELHVRTFHGFCARLIDGDAPRSRSHRLLTPIIERLLFQQVVQRASLSTIPLAARGSTRFATDALTFFAQAKGQGATPKDLAHIARDASNPRLKDLASLFSAMEAERGRLGMSDFRDYVNDAVAALGDPASPASRWWRAGRFAHILVDEFQDSDAVQLRLLELLAGDARTAPNPRPAICFVGDVNQSIYRFRGANPDNVRQVGERFNCAVLSLTANRRSAQAVLDVANATQSLDPQSLTTAENRALPGSVTLRRPASQKDEASLIADHIAQRIASGTAPSQIAVLLRAVEPLRTLVAASLAERGVPVAAHAGAGIHDDPLIAAIGAALALIRAQRDANRWTSLLVNPLIGYRAITVRMALRDEPFEPFDALIAEPPQGRRPFAEFAAAWRRVLAAYAAQEPDEFVATVVRELDLLGAVRDAAEVPGFDPRVSPRRLAQLMSAAHDLRGAWRGLGGGRYTTAKFVEELEEIVALLGDAVEPPDADAGGVRVMSIHAAKGLEFDAVVMPQALEGVLPARPRRHPLLDDGILDRLRAAEMLPDIGSEQSRREEASLWYVALTRARFDVLVTAPVRDADGIESALSPFAAMLAGDSENVARAGADGSPFGPRRIAREVSEALANATPAERLAPGVREYLSERPPLRALVEGSTLEVSVPASLRYDTGALSPSGISAYVKCPRQFYYKYVLGLEDRADDDATQPGMYLHTVLQRFHERETNFTAVTDAAAETERYRVALHRIAAEEAPAFAAALGIAPQAPRARYEAARVERYLHRYAALLAGEALRNPFTVLDRERWVEAEVAGVHVRGRLDRVDRLADGRLAIRDYKLGRRQGIGCAAAVRGALAVLSAGDPLFGDAPDGLSLQTIFYVPGVEAAFGARVARMDFIYMRGKDGKGDDAAPYADSVAILEAPDELDPTGAASNLTRAELERVWLEIGAAVMAECAGGEMRSFVTAVDVATCRFCPYTKVCPGPGMVTA
ncbi:MAG TPA: ATP-dependent DNA helicase [Candidatus Eremiobacteraceae bacterium]